MRSLIGLEKPNTVLFRKNYYRGRLGQYSLSIFVSLERKSDNTRVYLYVDQNNSTTADIVGGKSITIRY
jgi:hypothetical protein